MAQVTTKDIRTRIRNMMNEYMSITGQLIHVFDVAPMALPRANLPAVVITEGDATYDRTSRGKRYVKPSLTYNITLYAQEWTVEPKLNINEGVIDDFTTELEDMFTSYKNLIYNGVDLKGVSATFLVNNRAIAPRFYPNIQGAPVYVSKQFTLQVIYERVL